MVKKRIDKKFIVFLFLIMIISIIVIVYAASTTNFPVANGNYSGTLVFNCTTNLPEPLNASLLYNASGGAATEFLVTVVNNTNGDTEFYNGTVVITGLDDGSTYNMTCFVSNDSATEYSEAVGSVTIDNTVPNVTFSGITNTVDNGNYSGTIVINVSVNDATIGVDSVYFNITNTTSGTQINFTKASTAGGNSYNISLDTSVFIDGTYNVTVYSNDTLNNANNTEKIKITLDNTAPTVSISCSPVTLYVGDTVTCSCGVSDSTSGENSSATIYTVNPSTSNTGTKTEICSSADMAGNTGSDSTTFIVEARGTGSSSGGGGGGTTTSTWEKTITVPDEKFESGYTNQLSANHRFRVRIGTETHYVGIKGLTSNKATIVISSVPITVTLGVGESTKVDVEDDGYYEIYVKLLDITNNKANLFVQEINEKIPELSLQVVEETLDEEEREVPRTFPPLEEKSRGSLLITLILTILVIGIAAWVFISKKKKKK